MTDYLRVGFLGSALGVFIGVCRVMDWESANQDTAKAREIRRIIGTSTVCGIVASEILYHFVYRPNN